MSRATLRIDPLPIRKTNIVFSAHRQMVSQFWSDVRCAHPLSMPHNLDSPSQQHRLIERLSSQLSQMPDAGRLLVLGQAITKITHEINGRLAAATNYARACRNLADSSDKAVSKVVVDMLETLLTQLEATCEVANRFMAFGKPGGSQHAPIDINQVVTDMKLWLTPEKWSSSAAARPVISRLDLACELPLVLADRVQIEQVLINLIRNGVEAMEAVPFDERKLTIRTSRDMDTVSVCVVDYGCGIPPADLAQLFTSCRTTKAAGAGLGLAISRLIVDAHGGSIAAMPAVGGGTIVCFTLPIAGVRMK